MGLVWWNGGRVEQPIHFAHLSPFFSVILPLLFAVPGELLLRAPPPHARRVGRPRPLSRLPSLPPAIAPSGARLARFLCSRPQVIGQSRSVSGSAQGGPRIWRSGQRPSGDRDHNSMHFRNHMYSGSQADVGDGKHLVGNRGM